MSLTPREMHIYIDRIPQDKLYELANTFTSGTDAQQVLDHLSAADVEVSEEEAQALVASLFPKGAGVNWVSDENLDAVAGGKGDRFDGWRKITFLNGKEILIRYRCPRCCY